MPGGTAAIVSGLLHIRRDAPRRSPHELTF